MNGVRHSLLRQRRFRSNALPMKTIRAVILVIVVLALVAGPARAEKIRTAIPQANLNYLSIFVADAKGFFRDEGLDNETVVISGPLSIAALLSGDWTIAARAAAACAQRSK